MQWARGVRRGKSAENPGSQEGRKQKWSRKLNCRTSGTHKKTWMIIFGLPVKSMKYRVT